MPKLLGPLRSVGVYTIDAYTPEDTVRQRLRQHGIDPDRLIRDYVLHDWFLQEDNMPTQGNPYSSSRLPDAFLNDVLTPVDTGKKSANATELLETRLWWNSTKPTRKSWFMICHVSGPNVFTFWAIDGQGGHFEEPADMFPSDALVAKIRLMHA